MSRLTSPAIALCVLAAGCASAPDELIDYRTSGGFSGTGDGTSLQLKTDGTGTRTSHAGGTVTVALDATALAELNSRIEGAQFATLQPLYGCHGCADQVVFEVAVQLDGRRYQVSVDDGGVSYPDGLHALLDTLRNLAPP